MVKKIAKYKLIEDDLMEQINSGYYPVNSAIPTEHELAIIYKVSRVTVRQATNNLVAKGILVRSQGSGTYVAKRETLNRAPSINSFSEEMNELGKEVNTEIVEFKIIQASLNIANLLQCKNGDLIYYVERVRKADGNPLVFEITYMLVDKYPDMSYEVMKRSKYDYIENVKKDVIDYCHQVIIPIKANEKLANYLKCKIDDSLLKIMNTTYLKDSSVLDYTELIQNTKKYQYHVLKSR